MYIGCTVVGQDLVMRSMIISSKIGEDSQSQLWMLECLDVLLISSHVDFLNSEEIFPWLLV